jgi:pilus assembly protein CpaE
MDTLRLVGLMLERQDYEVIAANSGTKAVNMAINEQPDMILLDIMMPDMDGYEVTRQLRQNPLTANIPIIMFTAKTQIDDKLLGFEVGADDYLTKPTQPRELFAHVKAVLARTAKTHEASPNKDRGLSIGVLSTKGGLGVTTLTLNLGIAIHQQTQKDVVVAEFRPGQGTLSLELGYLQPEGLNRLLESNVTEISLNSVEKELVTHRSGVQILLSSHNPSDAKYIGEANVFEVIAKHLPYLARYTLIDLGPSLSPISDRVLNYCDNVIIVVEPVPYTILQSKTLIQDLTDSGFTKSQMMVVLINRVRSSVQLSWAQVQEQLGYNISTIFTPAPEHTYQASTHNIPIVIQQPESLTTEQFNKLAEKVIQRNL